MIRIDDEAPHGGRAREALLDASFGPSRILKTCERLREGRLPAPGLSLVARDGEAVIATLRFWNVEAGAGRPALLLGPLAVDARRRSAGLGAQLVRVGLSRAVAQGHGAVLLVGDAAYYARFGFEAALATALDLPGPVDRARFLGLELIPAALAGANGLVTATGEIARRHRVGMDLERRAA